MALDFPVPSAVGQTYTDAASGKVYTCTVLGPPAVWMSGVVAPSPDEFVTIATDQTVTGTKTFSATTTGFVNVSCSGDLTTSDLVMSNMHRDGNEVDGTTGHWCFQEGKNGVYVIDRVSGRRYSMDLTPVDE